MSEDHAVLPLPELPKEQTGTSVAKHKHYTASVSNAAGYLCHIHLECNLEVPPEVIFEIFCHPDNAGAFRDIKCVGYRKVKRQEPGLKVVEVEQCGELRVLWVHRVFRTYLDVTEDARDPECLRTEFSLLRSDLLSRFHGTWELRPRRDAAGIVVGCHAVLNQDVLPKGVPSFFAHLPVLGGLLRRVSLGTIQRLVEDILNIVKKYAAGGGKLTVDDVIAKIAAERGHKTIADEDRPGALDAAAGDAGSGDSSENGNGGSSSSTNNSSSDANVASFAIDSFTDSEAEDEDMEDKQGPQQQQAKQENGGNEAAAAVAAAEEQLQQLKLSHAGGSGELRSGTSSARVSADGVVTAVLVAPAAASSKGHAVCAELPTGKPGRQHSQKQQAHGRERPAVGVLLDVTVHDHVHVNLIPNPNAEV